MDNKLYVGNLPYSFRDGDLEQTFSAFGAVQSAKVMMERDTGRSKASALSKSSNAAEAQAAINGVHGQAFGGRDLVVNVALDEPALRAAALTVAMAPPRGGGFGGGNRGGY